MSNIVETHSARKPRIFFFYFLLGAMLLTLAGGLVFRQLFRSTLYSERERLQNQRRVIVPGPRGNIYDRNGQLIVTNQPRFSVTLNLGELGGEFDRETGKVAANYRSLDRSERPSYAEMTRLARVAVVQRYLDQTNTILGRNNQVDSRILDRHFAQTRLLPFVLLDNLTPQEYARLIERLPVRSPLQVYALSNRFYPYASAAAHALGYVTTNTDPPVEDFPGEDLMTFKMKGTEGRAGLEARYDEHLQGVAGGAIYRVDPAGFRVDLPLQKRLPEKGHNIITSLDIDLQVAAEQAMENRVGACVALEVKTGEVLVLVSKPDYNLNDFVPRLSTETARQIEESGAWFNRAIQGQYPPGSTFKLITTLAGLRSGAIDPHQSRTECPGYLMVGNRRFTCHRHSGHGERDLVGAIRDSCNVFFYTFGLEVGPQLIATEARRFGYGHPTGIELPAEFRNPVVPDPAWRLRVRNETWNRGDTANVAIGQGDLLVSPMQVACFMASFARGETETKPTLLHIADRPPLHTTPIGLSRDDYNTMVEGLEQCAQIGTAKFANVEGLRVAAKTGTAQKGRIELAWTIAYAPIENPQIAVAVVLEGSEEDTNFGGGVFAAPVVQTVLQAWRDGHLKPKVSGVTGR
ncbi:MAG: penicillin-binding transpeptidase domain-containing protein [Opitutaceae bacterium]|nr:penicillin-binding transpeptidase domain-containing protein [Opitutaceae bacterium]